jgi:hypothetical protein
VFITIYRGTLSGQRLRRGLARRLHDDPATLAFIDHFILSGDKNIPRSRQDPKILGRDDAEIIRDLVTIGAPFSGHVLAQKTSGSRL